MFFAGDKVVAVTVVVSWQMLLLAVLLWPLSQKHNAT